MPAFTGPCTVLTETKIPTNADDTLDVKLDAVKLRRITGLDTAAGDKYLFVDVGRVGVDEVEGVGRGLADALERAQHGSQLARAAGP